MSEPTAQLETAVFFFFLKNIDGKIRLKKMHLFCCCFSPLCLREKSMEFFLKKDVLERNVERNLDFSTPVVHHI